jgi:hypothetical protein
MADFFEKIAIEVPCPGCSGSYVASLEQIRLGLSLAHDPLTPRVRTPRRGSNC